MQHASLFLWVGLGLIATFVVVQLLRYPRQILGKLVRSAVAGCLFVLAVNWIGGYLHFHLPFNPFTALTAGLLGIPGVLALVALHLWVFPGG
jgi:inhibitor of the pro-sigma K processing machinery